MACGLKTPYWRLQTILKNFQIYKLILFTLPCQESYLLTNIIIISSIIVISYSTLVQLFLVGFLGDSINTNRILSAITMTYGQWNMKRTTC